MPLAPIGTPNTVFRAADTEEVAAGGDSLEDSFLDYATYGVAGTVTSAAVGIINTGKALGNALGGEFEAVDEGEVIGSTFGAGAKSFYGRHKTGVDAAGLIAGTLVPGLVAVKALRAVQVSGRVPGAIGAATGMAEADIMLGSASVQAARTAVMGEAATTGHFTLANPATYRAYAAGFKQNAIESVVFEAAALATNNQNATLNPDGLGYFESSWEAGKEGLPFVFGGAILGGVIDGFRTKGYLTKALVGEESRTAHLRMPELEAIAAGVPAGDRIMSLLEIGQARAINDVFKVADGDALALRQKQRGDSIVSRLLDEAFIEVNKAGDEGLELLKGLKSFGPEFSLAKAAEIVSGASKIEKFTLGAYGKEREFYAKSFAPFFINELDTVGIMAPFVYAKQLKNTLDSIRGKPYRGVFAQQMVEKARRSFTKDTSTTAGHNWGNPWHLQNPEGRAIYQHARNFQRGKGKGVVPIGEIMTNRAAGANLLPAHNAARTVLGMKPHTLDEFQGYVLMHEIGHWKSNGPELMRLFRQAKKAGGIANELVQELMILSRRARPASWENADNTIKRKAKKNGLTYLEQWDDDITKTGERNYLTQVVEMSADSAAMLTMKESREWAVKAAPKLAKLFEDNGMLTRPWNDRKLFYNSRKKEMLTSVLPGANDLGKVILKGNRIYIEGIGKDFKYNAKGWHEDVLHDATFKADPLEYSAHWAAVANKDIKDYWDDSLKKFVVEAGDLPAIEKLVTSGLEEANEFVIKAGKQMNIFAKEDATKMLMEHKKHLRFKMQSEGRYNEQELAHILNIGDDAAMGFNVDQWIQYGIRDYSKAENLIIRYKQIDLKDLQASTKSMEATQGRMQVMEDQRQTGASQILGKFFNLFPAAPEQEMIGTLSQLASRATLLTSARTEFGTLRDFASAVQRLTKDTIQERSTDIVNSYAKYYGIFNKATPESQVLRAELAVLDNELRKDWYTLYEHTNGQAYAVNREQFAILKSQVENSDNPEMAKAMLEDWLLKQTTDKSGAALKMSNEIADFFRLHKDMNKEIIEKKQALAYAKGRMINYDEDVLYPPPPDLRRTPFFAFVAPKAIIGEAEPQRYMIYADTAQELENKMAQVRNIHGETHTVVTKNDVERYKELTGEYEQGKVFDQMEFDAALFRKGRTGELSPSLDLTTSHVLDRYQSWTHRQHEFLTRSAVELKYGKLFTQLKALDAEFSDAAQSGFKILNQKPKDTIYADTYKMMLDSKSFGGVAEYGWKKINDFVGEKGSEVLDGILGAFSKTKGVITQAQLDEMNTKLSDAGYNAPFKDAMEAIAASTDRDVTRSLPAVVRTMNNLVSTFMLKLDVLNSVVQTISTPILLSPVLKEAQQALANTPRGKALGQLVTVVNPANGMREPTAMKMMSRATKNYFSPEGRAFQEELANRGLLPDSLREYFEAIDFSELNGRHTLNAINQKVDALARAGTKITRYQQSEQFSRFLVADSIRQICEIRGIGGDEMFTLIGSAIDKVHGVYRKTNRAQLFNGTVGQAIGLYQTYMFNFMQNVLKYTQNGEKAQLAMIAGLQGGIYGLRSFPGFTTFNTMIAETNRDNLDLYSVTGADDPKSMMAYAMYGLGSHALITPVGLFSRGDMVVRNSLVVPTSPGEIPGVAIISKAIGNAINTAKLLGDPNVPNDQALAHGFAHNGMNRPLQGLAQIYMGQITSGQGTPYFRNSNYIDNDAAKELHYGGMFARIIGSKPLNEAIMLDTYFRRKQYQASARANSEDVGMAIKVAMAGGENLDTGMINDYALDYERSGGDLENFNAFWGRQLATLQQTDVQKFHDSMTRDDVAKRAYNRMLVERSAKKPWEFTNMDIEQTPEGLPPTE